jgi:hypothetical protein
MISLLNASVRFFSLFIRYNDETRSASALVTVWCED